MTDSKTATERLREMLDARGVEYEEINTGKHYVFQLDYCEQCGGYMKSIVITGECISAYSDYLTPEQAIAATLGSEPDETMNHETTDLRGKLNKLIIELYHLDYMVDSPGSNMTLGEYEQERERLLDEFVQAIAATRGSGECEPTEEYACSTCGQDLVACDVDVGPNGGAIELDPPILFNFCPNCGRVVKR